MFFSNNWILFLHPLAFCSTFYELKREAVHGRRDEDDWVQVSFGLAYEQTFSRAGRGEGKAKRPVDRPLGSPFHGTRCPSDPDASSYWREHWLLTGLIDIGFSVGT